ncbi:hypothetical protein [Aestuariirhabdus litorea]|uniref:Uncharacterized protein n=1 Tax=Aestuariirhabdus litorea TaxID=2528527 RepID=A0A3P3VIF4_9GAMM|nr:hypothetical protein [Aestuariirhabdus litorea]RRJ82500.1 hypothetical protein D0544_11545 [Aestuariirhabdus litorea]RWW92661.1 hypothetical protein DZC74_11520 [Endozoicomonadaceae bacterium GTF-13]
MWIHRWLFPPQGRSFHGKRWSMILLRTLHLLGVAGTGASFLVTGGAPPPATYLHILLFSGLLMALIEIWGHGVWLLQLKGLSVLVKLALIAAMLYWPAQSAPLFISIILISGIIAHAPGYVRYYSPWHRRRLPHP